MDAILISNDARGIDRNKHGRRPGSRRDPATSPARRDWVLLRCQPAILADAAQGRGWKVAPIPTRGHRLHSGARLRRRHLAILGTRRRAAMVARRPCMPPRRDARHAQWTRRIAASVDIDPGCPRPPVVKGDGAEVGSMSALHSSTEESFSSMLQRQSSPTGLRWSARLMSYQICEAARELMSAIL